MKFQTPPATIAPLVREAFLNLSLGLAEHEKVFGGAGAVSGFKFVLENAPLPVQGALLAPGQKLVYTRKVLTDKGLFLYYSTNNGVTTVMASKSKSGEGTAEFQPDLKNKIYAAGAGGDGNSETKGDTITVTITNKSKKPCFLVIVAMIGGKPAGANLPLIPALKNLSVELPKMLAAQKTGNVPLNTTSFYGQALAPKTSFAAGKPGQVFGAASSDGSATAEAGQITNTGGQPTLCVLAALNP
jgi:hypothetical protein